MKPIKPIRPIKPIKQILSITLVTLLCSCLVKSQEKPTENAQEIADKLSNPIADMISVPFQNNVDYGIGPWNGSKYTLNFQPVIPISLGPSLNLITRYIIPIVDQRNVTGEGNNEFGISDALVSAFFAPVTAKKGLLWGLGPVFLFPTGTDDLLSARKWGAGPTALILKQSKGVTYGFLVNQVWSFAGDDDRADVNQFFLQPFFAHNWKSGAGLGLNAEMTHNWENSTTTTFLNPIVTGITRLGKQIISMGVGPRIPLGGPEESMADFGIRAVLTFVFVK